MKLTLTTEDVLLILKEHFKSCGFYDDLEIEIEIDPEISSIAEPVETESRSVMTYPIYFRMLHLLQSDVNRQEKKKHIKPGTSEIRVPANPQLDYEKYGLLIEEFINSKETCKVIEPEEGVKNTGLLYRYRIASEIYGYRSKISLTIARNSNKLIMSNKDLVSHEHHSNKNSAKAYIK